MKQFPKGSEWQKWDLHIHTPFTKLNNQFSNDWEAYVRAIIDQELSVIGATNYFCFSDNEIENTRSKLEGGGFEGVVLPNLEFRLNQQNKDDDFINIHLLFSESISTDKINRAFNRLPITNTTSDGKPIYCIEEDLESSGVSIDTILVELSSLLDCVDQHFHIGSDVLVIGCPNGYGSYRPARGDGRGNNYAIEIDKKLGALFGNQDDREFFLQPEGSRFDGSIKKPVYHCSDAHKISEVGQGFTWIKANPNFEGLVQTLFEPEERVRIQQDNPSLDYAKPYFSSLKFLGSVIDGGSPSFSSSEIPLNANLVALIGGRGTGKSILFDCVYKTFDQTNELKEKRIQAISPDDFEVSYLKPDGTKESYEYGEVANLDYLHVRQGEIKRVAETSESLSDALKKLLGIYGENDVPQYDTDFRLILEKIHKTKFWFDEVDSEGKKLNDVSRNKQIIQQNKNLIETITTDGNKKNIEKFQQSSEKANQLKSYLRKLSDLKAKLEFFEKDTNNEIDLINESQLSDPKLTKVSFNHSYQEINSLERKYFTEIADIEVQNDDIRNDLRQQGVDQDVSTLLKKVDFYKKEIDSAKFRIDEFKVKEKTLVSFIDERSALVERIKVDLEEQSRSITTTFEGLTATNGELNEDQQSLITDLLNEINIEGKIYFDVKVFYQGLKQLLHGSKFRSSDSVSKEEKIQQTFNVNNFDDFLNLARNEKIIDLGDLEDINLETFSTLSDYFVRNGFNIFEYIFLHEHRSKYLYVKPVIEYLGKSPEKLSVGQRGTFYVCMKLATDAFGSPFIFDQPEDDLDNKFIMNQLVPIFRKIKKYRQVIIATHNANLVVNADAEQVIVAENDDEVLSYKSGAIECTEIRNDICEILEGGQSAFEKREQKYGF
ncbi:TrlF family AAA-like ATPase [Thiomicrospira sp. WB1]|uniref:TrlF family AAA-like ATPase n=1 Tax=Thiomicrospira sp. WB1 TaxID=1685380 RepID=UPI000748A42A|nr:hypothetical protein [Thiomicrospira sp. WB1]KUJ72509.1 hypothetical protein AVO41_01480 [Thiomicrospira sp. WB1]